MSDELPLRGPDMPDPLSWWPPAPGWWLLLLLLLIILLAVSVWLKRPRRINYWVEAQKQLGEIEQTSDDHLLQLQQISALLRRMAMLRFGREESASLTGDAWLELLDSAWTRDDFSRGAGVLLEDAPYRKESDSDNSELIDITREWLQYQQTPPPEQQVKQDV
ncbi:MAG: DUF4381 domain-containing protein [Pseudomonadota bacterium]